MKILILSDINSAHTEKWVRGLCSNGVTVCLFSFSSPIIHWYRELENFEIGFAPKTSQKSTGFMGKIGYLTYLPRLRKCIRQFKPNVLHAHYASSYGLVGKLSGFQPFMVSVWGADVYDFPKSSWVNRKVLKSVLKSADHISSTSNSMAIETGKYTDKRIQTIPFGIDTSAFLCPERKKILATDQIVIGNVKSLTPKYGTDYLIQTFHQLTVERPELNLKLLLVGGGSHMDEYKQLVRSLNLEDKVTFTGFIALEQVPMYHCKIDIFVSLSILDSESFGVSLVEAMASGSKIVASKVSGFKEVLRDCDSYGLMVSPKSVEEAKSAILKIIDNPVAAESRSQAALGIAKEHYEWHNNLSEMLDAYRQLMKTKKQ